MRPALGAIGATLLLASSLFCQNLVAIPAHSAIYNGFSRGFNFTAQATFNIVQLDLPLDAFQAGDTASYLVRVNGATVLHSVGNPGLISTAIPIAVNDVVDVIGNWSPAAPASFSAHNSYTAAVAPFATTIEGVAHTLQRTGWQYDVGVSPLTGTYLAPGAGQMGRVLMYTSSALGFAQKTPFGSGCYNQPRMVYERFLGNVTPVDLTNTQQIMVYASNANGGFYIVAPGASPYDAVTAAANGTNLVLGSFTSAYNATVGGWDDATVVLTLPAAQFPTGFPFPGVGGGGNTTTISVNSNGKVYLGSINPTDVLFATHGSNYADTAPFQGTTGAGLPVLAPFNCDIDPSPVGGGAIWYESPSPNGGVRITWAGVPNWQNTVAGSPPFVICDVQMELLPSGLVMFAYGASLGTGGSANNDAIVGFSAGGGQPMSPQVDWSALTPYISGDGSVPLTIDSNLRPVLGTSINITIGNIPAATPFAGVLYGFTKFDPGIPLAGIGMPGCQQYTTQQAVSLGITPGATFTTPLGIPNNIAFVGLQVVCQGAVYNPPAVPNTLGALSSNGLELILDVN
jgi:hypothetical protein